MTEQLHFHFSLSCIGEGNGNPLQCSCLESPRDSRAWWAAVYGVTQSRTRLKWLSSSSSIHCWWECKVVQLLQKTLWRCLKNINIELPYDPAITLLGIYPRGTQRPTPKDICTPMFTEALFTITDSWKQQGSTGRWMKKRYMMKYYSAIKRRGNPTIYDNMNGFEGIMLKEISQRKTNTIWFHLYVKLGGKKAKIPPTPNS